MIPKIIHLIWLGGQKPEKFNTTLERIAKINNHYKIIEWNDSNIDFELETQEVFNKTENLAAKSDILRFELLKKYGGIYMDYDFLQIKKFDELLTYDFFVGAGLENEVWNSIVGSQKEHKISIDFLNGLKQSEPITKHTEDQIGSVMSTTGPYYLEKIYKSNSNLENIKYLSKNYFFPFPGDQRQLVRDMSENSLKYVESFATEETICIHFHTCTWQ